MRRPENRPSGGLHLNTNKRDQIIGITKFKKRQSDGKQWTVVVAHDNFTFFPMKTDNFPFCNLLARKMQLYLHFLVPLFTYFEKVNL
jgi:hypothetical protein